MGNPRCGSALQRENAGLRSMWMYGSALHGVVERAQERTHSHAVQKPDCVQGKVLRSALCRRHDTAMTQRVRRIANRDWLEPTTTQIMQGGTTTSAEAGKPGRRSCEGFIDSGGRCNSLSVVFH